MPSAGEVAWRLYEAAQRKAIAGCRSCLSDSLVFAGLFETCYGLES